MLTVGTIVTVNTGVEMPLGVKVLSTARTGTIVAIGGYGRIVSVAFPTTTGNSTVSGAFAATHVTTTTEQSQA